MGSSSGSFTLTNLTALVTVILTLSIASERLVEIIKGFVPFLDKINADSRKEGRRRSVLQMLAVVSGICTAFLAHEYMPYGDNLSLLGLGLLASGGSGLWNSILSYVTNLKELKKVEVIASKMNLTSQKLASSHVQST